jgi:hypothetical protein
VSSGRSAAWLARLVRDQEAGGSNPLAPTIFFKQIELIGEAKLALPRRYAGPIPSKPAELFPELARLGGELIQVPNDLVAMSAQMGNNQMVQHERHRFDSPAWILAR